VHLEFPWMPVGFKESILLRKIIAHPLLLDDFHYDKDNQVITNLEMLYVIFVDWHPGATKLLRVNPDMEFVVCCDESEVYYKNKDPEPIPYIPPPPPPPPVEIIIKTIIVD